MFSCLHFTSCFQYYTLLLCLQRWSVSVICQPLCKIRSSSSLLCLSVVSFPMVSVRRSSEAPSLIASSLACTYVVTAHLAMDTPGHSHSADLCHLKIMLESMNEWIGGGQTVSRINMIRLLAFSTVTPVFCIVFVPLSVRTVWHLSEVSCVTLSCMFVPLYELLYGTEPNNGLCPLRVFVLFPRHQAP